LTSVIVSRPKAAPEKKEGRFRTPDHVDGLCFTCSKTIHACLPWLADQLSRAVAAATWIPKHTVLYPVELVTCSDGCLNSQLRFAVRDWLAVVRGQHGDLRPGLFETPLFFEISLCLSRACLGKMMHFIYKWHRKKWNAFLT
jgi:hypothetical protein